LVGSGGFAIFIIGQPPCGRLFFFYLKYTTKKVVCKGLISMDNLLPVLKNIVSYALPIITCVTVVIGGVWTLYKYFKEKNRDFYSEILAKVYEPLFTQLVKMEYSRKLLEKSLEVKSKGGENSGRVTLMQDDVSKGAFSVKEVPFISWGSTKTNTEIKIGQTTVKQEEYANGLGMACFGCPQFSKR